MPTFRSTVELGGKTATGIEVPAEVIEALGRGKRASVQITLGTHAYRTTVASRGGRFLVPLSAENREAAGLAAGDVVEVGIEPDDSPRVVEVPPDLAAAFAAEPALQERWDALATSYRKEYARSIDEAKKPETRERRLAKALDALRRAG